MRLFFSPTKFAFHEDKGGEGGVADEGREEEVEKEEEKKKR